MKLSNFAAVAALLKAHGEVVPAVMVKEIADKVMSLPIAEEMKRKMVDAIDSVATAERASIEDRLEKLGVEVDDEVKSVVAKVGEVFGKGIALAERKVDEALRPAASLGGADPVANLPGEPSAAEAAAFAARRGSRFAGGPAA